MSRERMDEFVEQLEGRLRVAAREHGRRSAARLRLAVGAAAVLVIAVVGTALAVSTGGGVGEARAAPPVTKRPVGAVVSLERSSELAARGARLDEVRTLPAPGGRAFLVPVVDGWCLVGPDPATDHPQEEYALTCVSDASFRQNGISLSLANPSGGYVLIAPPAGARAPEIPDGTGARRPIEVHDGVALASPVAAGTTITTYDRNDEPRALVMPDGGQTRPDGGSLQDCGDGALVPAGAC